MLVTMRSILDAADKYSYGQAAFNINSIGQIEAAIKIHEIMESPAILQGAEASNGFMSGNMDFMNSSLEDKIKGAKIIGDAVKKYADNSFVPVALHLDHGKSLDVVKACIDGGYTSVMIDGSHLPLNENIELTREVVKYAHQYGVSVEAELGVLAGVEDHIFSASSSYTNPLDAVEFFKKTKCDALAISYGTSHGSQKGKDTKIRREIAIAIKECMRHAGIEGYLVSHGSSTVPKEYVEAINSMGGRLKDAYGINVSQLVDVIAGGINKINVDTDIRLACTKNIMKMFLDNPNLQNSKTIGKVYEKLIENPENIDPRNYVESVIDAIIYGKILDDDTRKLIDVMKLSTQQAIAPLLVQFGSYRKANLVDVMTIEQMAEKYKKEGI